MSDDPADPNEERLRSMLKKLPKVDAPPDFEARLQRRITSAPPNEGKRAVFRGFRAPAIAYTVLAAALIGALWYYEFVTPSFQPEPPSQSVPSANERNAAPPENRPAQQNQAEEPSPKDADVQRQSGPVRQAVPRKPPEAGARTAIRPQQPSREESENAKLMKETPQVDKKSAQPAVSAPSIAPEAAARTAIHPPQPTRDEFNRTKPTRGSPGLEKKSAEPAVSTPSMAPEAAPAVKSFERGLVQPQERNMKSVANSSAKADSARIDSLMRHSLERHLKMRKIKPND